VFEKIEQGLEAYKKELRDYWAYTGELRRQYGEHLNLFSLENPDWQRVMERNSYLKGMEKALNLERVEIIKIQQDLGLK